MTTIKSKLVILFYHMSMSVTHSKNFKLIFKHLQYIFSLFICRNLPLVVGLTTDAHIWATQNLRCLMANANGAHVTFVSSTWNQISMELYHTLWLSDWPGWTLACSKWLHLNSRKTLGLARHQAAAHTQRSRYIPHQQHTLPEAHRTLLYTWSDLRKYRRDFH